MEDREESVQHFLDLIKRSRRGKFKIYIGMIAGVGKSYRMLQEAHEMLENGVDVQIGYIETHGRAGTVAMLEGLPVISRKKIFYKGKEVEEMDLDAILQLHPELVIVDELAHTNIEGSRNEKRWQDVMELLDAGINVISAVNIQHIESLNEDVKGIAGIEVKERIPDNSLRILSKSMFISSRLKRSSICILRNCILLHCVCSVKNGAMRRQMWFSRPYCTISSSLRRSVWLRNNIQLTFKVLNNFRRLFSSSIKYI